MYIYAIKEIDINNLSRDADLKVFMANPFILNYRVLLFPIFQSKVVIIFSPLSTTFVHKTFFILFKKRKKVGRPRPRVVMVI